MQLRARITRKAEATSCCCSYSKEIARDFLVRYCLEYKFRVCLILREEIRKEGFFFLFLGQERVMRVSSGVPLNSRILRMCISENFSS